MLFLILLQKICYQLHKIFVSSLHGIFVPIPVISFCPVILENYRKPTILLAHYIPVLGMKQDLSYGQSSCNMTLLDDIDLNM